jgi:DNA repair protein SbcD/Mre11
MARFIHAADIHLDSPLKGLERYEGAPANEIREATRRALRNLVALAVDERVDFVVIAGDLYDGDWRDYNTGLFFLQQMAELARSGVPVYMAAGNHDAQSVVTKRLRLPENVHLFDTKRPETFELKELGIAIHGQGFRTKAVKEDLSAGYPAAMPGAFNIGVLHTSLTGREGHENYAPCTVEGLMRLGYDYWALGHVHTRECVKESGPAIWFPGNVQGRHVREEGEKGCLLVEAEHSRSVSVRFHALDVVRWAQLAVDVSEAQTLDECLDAFQNELRAAIEPLDGRMLAVRVVFKGQSRVHERLTSQPAQFLNELRAMANMEGKGAVWIEKVKTETRPRALKVASAMLEGPIEQMRSIVDELTAGGASLHELEQTLRPLLHKLPKDIEEDPEALFLTAPEGMRGLLRTAEALLIERLREKE